MLLMMTVVVMPTMRAMTHVAPWLLSDRAPFVNRDDLRGFFREGLTVTPLAHRRSARDYAWIMSRSPIIADDVYKGLVQRVVDLGYPTTNLVKPHQDPPPRETKF